MSSHYPGLLSFGVVCNITARGRVHTWTLSFLFPDVFSYLPCSSLLFQYRISQPWLSWQQGLDNSVLGVHGDGGGGASCVLYILGNSGSIPGPYSLDISIKLVFSPVGTTKDTHKPCQTSRKRGKIAPVASYLSRTFSALS